MTGPWIGGAQTADAAAAALLRLDGCSKSYKRGGETVHALIDATLTLHPGELVALVGPSGSGKTTLLNILVGWETPDQGCVTWSGDDSPSRLSDWHDLGIVPQRLGLLEELTIGQNITLPLRLGALPSRTRRRLKRGDRDRQRSQLTISNAARVAEHATELVEELGLTALTHRLPDEASLGEQQRAAIARALVLSPALLVLDEPTGHQDETNANAVLAVLRRARDRGTCCLLATHARDVRAHVDRVVGIRDGRLLKAAVDGAGADEG